MGFFDKLKSAKNVLTGGSAKVFLQAHNTKLGSPLSFTVSAHIGDADVKISRVYLKIVGEEEINMPHREALYEYEEEETDHHRRGSVYCRSKTIDLDIPVADGNTLKANQQYSWDVDTTLPNNTPPTYYGTYCKHTYTACAFLDTFGNDPDSGWIDIHLEP